MPEIVTKYPKLLLQELKEANIQCGGNLKPQILTSCPTDHFCSLPTGEICVYDLKEVSNMTQIHMFDLFLFPGTAIALGALMVMIFLVGLIIGMRMKNND